jgi:hypothetical protein
MMRTKGFAEGLTQGLFDRSCMYGVRGSITTQPAVNTVFRRVTIATIDAVTNVVMCFIVS